MLYPILIEQWLENRKRPQPRPRVSPIPDTYQLGMQVDYLIEECRWARGRIGQLEGRLEAQESAQ